MGKDSLLDPARRFGGIGIHQAKSLLKKFNDKISIHDKVEGEVSECAEFRLWFPKFI